MNSTFLRVMAAFMVIAALLTAFLGYRQSHHQSKDTLKVVVPTYSQVVATRDLPAGHTLMANDLAIITTQQLDKKTFSEPQSLIGKVIVAPISKGGSLKSLHIPPGNKLSQALAQNERAIAIKVNEVIGVGGFVKPEDHVDVLLFLRADKENGATSSAQVVITNVKVLAYGDLVTNEEIEQNSSPSESKTITLGGQKKSTETSKNSDSRSAILAVKEQDVAKLMLAESAGQLRLALRAKSYQASNTTESESNRFIRMGDIAQTSNMNNVMATRAEPSNKTTAAKISIKKSVSDKERVTIHRGDKVEVISVVK